MTQKQESPTYGSVTRCHIQRGRCWKVGHFSSHSKCAFLSLHLKITTERNSWRSSVSRCWIQMFDHVKVKRQTAIWKCHQEASNSRSLCSMWMRSLSFTLHLCYCHHYAIFNWDPQNHIHPDCTMSKIYDTESHGYKLMATRQESGYHSRQLDNGYNKRHI